MEFSSLSEFLAMGKHGPFVWSAYGITFAVIMANIVFPVLRKKALVNDIKRKLKREQAGL